MSTAGTLRGVIRKSVVSVLYVTVNCARSRCSCHSRCTGRRTLRTHAALTLLPCCSTSLCALPFRLCNCPSTPAQSLRTHRPAAVLRRQEQTLRSRLRSCPLVSVWSAVPVLRVPARWQRRPVARHPAAVTWPLSPARLRSCLSARRPALHARRVLVFTRRDRSIACARC